MTTNMVGGMQIKTTITKAKRTSTRNHGKIRTKSHGTKIIKHNMVIKESKPKDACITVTKDVKYFCPTGFDKGIFNAMTKLLHEKVERAKRSGIRQCKDCQCNRT